MAAVDPTVQLAEGLRELATAAYGDPGAEWQNPQQLVRDALRQAAVLQITPEKVQRAIVYMNTQTDVMVISSQTDPAQHEQVMDRWLLGLLTAALTDNDVPVLLSTPPSLTLDDFAVEQFNSPRNTATFHLLVKGEEVAKRVISIMDEADRRANHMACRILTNEWNVEDEKERAKQWVESVQTIFGDEAKPYLDRLILS